MLDYDFRTAFRSVGSSKTENDSNLFQIVNLDFQDFQDLLQVTCFFPTLFVYRSCVFKLSKWKRSGKYS
jgi:hypothetical protein